MPWSEIKASSTARGYGRTHRSARAAAAAAHDPANPCARCGHALGPMGPWLHWDHNDARNGWLGFSHGRPCPVCRRSCNVEAGAMKGRQRQKAVRIIVAQRW